MKRKVMPFCIRKFIYEKHNKTCVYCGKVTNLFKGRDWHNLGVVDHIIPVKHGGSDQLDNLQLLCAPCNAKKFCNPTYHDKIMGGCTDV